MAFTTVEKLYLKGNNCAQELLSLKHKFPSASLLLLGLFVTPRMLQQMSEECEKSGQVDLREAGVVVAGALLELPALFPKMRRLFTMVQNAGVHQQCCASNQMNECLSSASSVTPPHSNRAISL